MAMAERATTEEAAPPARTKRKGFIIARFFIQRLCPTWSWQRRLTVPQLPEQIEFIDPCTKVVFVG